MRSVECSRCGSNELLERDGYVVCAYCQSQFVRQASDLPVKDTTIGIVDDVQRLLQQCRDDPGNRHRYANLILDLDPTNQQAIQYLR